MMKVEEFIAQVLEQKITNPRDLIVCGIKYCRDVISQERGLLGEFEDESEFFARHLLKRLDSQLQTLIDEGDL